MNIEDKHIDELFRSAANETAAPEFHSAYWKEMEALLDAEKKHQKGLIFWTSFGGLVMIGLISTLFVSLSTEAKYSKLAVSLNSVQNEELDYENTYTLVNGESFSETKLTNQPLANTIDVQAVNTDLFSNLENETPSISNEKKNFGNRNNQSLIVEQLPLLTYSLTFEAIQQVEQSEQFSTLNSASKSLTKSLEFGGGASQTYDNEKSHPTLFSASFKLDYKKKGFVFSSGLGLQIEQNTGITVSERAQVYGFGVTNFENSLNYKTLIDLTIPIQVAYETGKNRFGFGAQLRCLATSKMRFESKENGEIMSADNLSGLTTGLNPFNADAYGFYERAISQNISLGLRVTQQLTSRISSDDYFNNLDRTKTFNGQVYLKYMLFQN
jgi:hypothetical protein